MAAVPAADTISRRVVVRGHVQGVFFRDSTHERASSLGVAGWVRNRADRAVEAVFKAPATTWRQ